ncbi:hypothetical protein NDI56_10490 [Haloarcula sp. S1CR25-12]|uniref:Uncharacterized protein n=1 Tax=Haloarcula saliterrae TaxID=2950534 RepID=A0ABU2FC32_9EURY|nr:hypothetical protein [Haloarcula sp. S1CR25-12]MDS0259819.1 hypothetical protein [Haloarcula sp. S1CR25-12]
MIVPLQAGSPVNVELFIILGMMGLLFLANLGVSVWIYRDAKRRNVSHAFAWGAGSFLSGFLGGIGAVVLWVLYFVVRDEQGSGGPSVRGES